MRSQFNRQRIVDTLVIDPYFKQVPYVNNINDDAITSNFGYSTQSITTGGTAPQRASYAAKWGTAGMDKVSGGYLNIGGTGTTDYSIGTQDFTIECWIQFVGSTRGYTASYNYGLFSLNTLSGAGNKVWLLQWIGTTGTTLSTGKLNHAFYDGTTFSPPAVYFNANTWTHVSVCRQGSNLYSSINGVVNLTNTTSMNVGTISTGSRWGTSAAGENQHNVYLDDMRITVGFARYTSNFPVPEKQLPIPTRPNN